MKNKMSPSSFRRQRGGGDSAMAGCYMVYFILMLCFGSWSVNECLNVIIGHQIPWYFAILVALLAGTITTPLSILCWVVTMCGVSTPWLHVNDQNASTPVSVSQPAPVSVANPSADGSGGRLSAPASAPTSVDSGGSKSGPIDSTK